MGVPLGLDLNLIQVRAGQNLNQIQVGEGENLNLIQVRSAKNLNLIQVRRWENLNLIQVSGAKNLNLIPINLNQIPIDLNQIQIAYLHIRAQENLNRISRERDQDQHPRAREANSGREGAPAVDPKAGSAAGTGGAEAAGGGGRANSELTPEDPFAFLDEEQRELYLPDLAQLLRDYPDLSASDRAYTRIIGLSFRDPPPVQWLLRVGADPPAGYGWPRLLAALWITRQEADSPGQKYASKVLKNLGTAKRTATQTTNRRAGHGRSPDTDSDTDTRQRGHTGGYTDGHTGGHTGGYTGGSPGSHPGSQSGDGHVGREPAGEAASANGSRFNRRGRHDAGLPAATPGLSRSYRGLIET